jgi:apolipoprotein N-acyltransferase
MAPKISFWKRPSFRTSVIAPASSALLLLGAYSPFDLRFLVFVALVPWLLAFPYATAKEARRAGLAFNFVFILGQMFFVAILTARWTNSWGLALVPWLICGLLGTFYFMVLSLAMNWCYKTQRLWLVPLAWAAVEIWRSYMPVLAFPWGLIAEPLAPYPALINSAVWLTIYGVGAWVVLGNMVLSELVRKRVPKTACACFALVLVSSLLLYSRPIVGTPRNIIIGQPGVDMAFTEPVLAHSLIGPAADRILDVAEAQHADLTVLPEGLEEVKGTTPSNLGFRPRADAPVLFGGQRGNSPGYQSAFTYDGTWRHADKTRLVIFGEFVPSLLRNVLPESFRLPSGDLQAGDTVTALPVGNLTVGPIICFEEMFPDVCYKQRANGAQLLAIISMDDWFQHTPAFEQLRDSCVFRAIETGLPIVRSTTTGYSLAIDQRGRVIASTPPGSWAALPATILVH